MNIEVDESRVAHSSRTFPEIITESNMIISKGQRNYETFPDNKKIFFMLLAKCPIIAKELGAEQGDIILKRGTG